MFYFVDYVISLFCGYVGRIQGAVVLLSRTDLLSVAELDVVALAFCS